MHGVYILEKEAIEKISKDLQLPYRGDDQDWDIQMSDQTRLAEFIAYYHKHDLNNDEKHALIALLLASYEWLLEDEGIHDANIWNQIKQFVSDNRSICEQLVAYWIGYVANNSTLKPIYLELIEEV